MGYKQRQKRTAARTRKSFGEPELCGVFVVAIIGAHGGMTRHAGYGSDPFVAPVRAVSGELGPFSRSKKRAGPERRFGAFVAICEGLRPRLQQRRKSSTSNCINLLRKYALKWKIIQPERTEKAWSKNKQEKARRQNGAFAVHTARQSRAGGLETTGFFGSCIA